MADGIFTENLERREPRHISTDIDIAAAMPEILTHAVQYVFSCGGEDFEVRSYFREPLRKIPNPTIDDFKAIQFGMEESISLVAIRTVDQTPVAIFCFYANGDHSVFLSQAIDVDPLFQQRGIAPAMWEKASSTYKVRIRPSGRQSEHGAIMLNKLLAKGIIDYADPLPDLPALI